MPPLAYAVVQLTDVVFVGAPIFNCMVEIGWNYPAKSAIGAFDTEVQVDYGSAGQIHAQIAAAVQELVATELIASHDDNVPADRIAVTLL